jgi:hypothetical protein
MAANKVQLRRSKVGILGRSAARVQQRSVEARGAGRPTDARSGRSRDVDAGSNAGHRPVGDDGQVRPERPARGAAWRERRVAA